MSVLFQPPPVALPLCLTQLGAVAVTDVLHQDSLPGVRLRWPNDVLVLGRKIAGILVETRSQGEQIAAAVMGLGLNVEQTPEDFRGDYRTPPTSLRMLGR